MEKELGIFEHSSFEFELNIDLLNNFIRVLNVEEKTAKK